MQRSRGFTIVELLIVIVVIAILAAITIVAYNGIQNRAKQSAAQSRLTQANKKILAYAVQNSDTYPESLSQAEVDNSDNALQYSVDNNASPKSYGLTATNGNFSYYVTSTNSSPVAGGYQGHGSYGVAAIENLVRNPKAATATTDWGSSPGTGATGSTSTVATGGPAGIPSYRRLTWSVAPTTGAVHQSNSSTSTNLISAGKTYTISSYMRPSWAAAATRLTASVVDSGGTTLATWATPDTNHAQGQWIRRSISGEAPVGAFRIIMYNYAAAGNTTRPAINDTFDVTGLQITEGATLQTYADGDSPNWVWTGTPNVSTSRGPAL